MERTDWPITTSYVIPTWQPLVNTFDPNAPLDRSKPGITPKPKPTRKRRRKNGTHR